MVCAEMSWSQGIEELKKSFSRLTSTSLQSRDCMVYFVRDGVGAADHTEVKLSDGHVR